MKPVQWLSSRENPHIKQLRQWIKQPQHHHDGLWFWIEGEHLCSALHQATTFQGTWEVLVCSQACWQAGDALLTELLAHSPNQIWVLPNELLAQWSELKTPPTPYHAMGVVCRLPLLKPHLEQKPSVVLDRLQDAGNVGAVLRAAAAFGFQQIIALKGTAKLWSPKVLRSGMGAHFSLTLWEGLKADDLQHWTVPRLMTSSHQGKWLHETVTSLPSPCAWVFGNEGGGVGEALLRQPHQAIRIAQPGGQESLNVAQAAAICLYASATAHL